MIFCAHTKTFDANRYRLLAADVLPYLFAIRAKLRPYFFGNLADFINKMKNDI